MANAIMTVGWREFVSLPELDLHQLKAKIDTGARTSCLHAFSIEPYEKKEVQWIRFGIHPNQGDMQVKQYCDAKVVDQRLVSDSGGHKEMRYVISTLLVMGSQQWPVEMTLTNRDSMRFRILIGRTAMTNRIVVDPTASYLTTDKPHIGVRQRSSPRIR